ncbi:MAG: matrixin family metalloprotease [Anaerolineae bacterium]|nr:matrixin family metalloprotease [Anaerolineae bacterium]
MKRLFTSVILLLIFSLTITTQAQDKRLRYAEPVDGILAAGASERYTFEGAQGDKPLIIMNAKGGEMDPVVRLYNPEGQLIAEDDNSNGKRNARIENVVLAESGVYTVEAMNQAGGSGNYSLIVDETSQVIFYHGEDTLRTGMENFELTSPWPYTTITYSVLNTLSNFNAQDVESVIHDAFQAWANETPLTFQEVSGQRADIVVSFDRIDGPSNVLGQACPPSSPCAGEVVFDVDEYWILREPQYYDDISLLGVATHEFGHAIGLLHSTDTSALMYPQYSAYNIYPSTDDINGVQRLYGAGNGAVYNPTPAPGSGQPTDQGQLAVEGTITDNQFIQFWDFDVVAGENVTIQMESLSGGLDPFLVIIDTNDYVLAFDDDSAGDFDAVIRNISFPQTGTYTVAATRFSMAQGYTTGDYRLSIAYGETAAATVAPRSQPTSGPVDGTVRTSTVPESALQEYPSIESVLNRTFIDSTTPLSQSASGTVLADQNYIWLLPWCARDEATLRDNLEQMDFIFEANGTPVSNVTQVITAQNDLTCALNFVLLSDWQGNRLTLQSTLRLNQAVFDGFSVYSAGDYTYNYDLSIR